MRVDATGNSLLRSLLMLSGTAPTGRADPAGRARPGAEPVPTLPRSLPPPDPARPAPGTPGTAPPAVTVELSPEAVAASRAITDDVADTGPRVETKAGTETETDPTAPRGRDGEPLDDEAQREVEKLRQGDREVRRHEAAHKAAAGPYARGGPTYEYQEGPDGRRYAVGGHVEIDMSPVPDDPEATIRKMQVIRQAAMAPADPSSQDRQVAAQAARQAQAARSDAQGEQPEAGDGTARIAESAGRSGTAASAPPVPPVSNTGTAEPDEHDPRTDRALEAYLAPAGLSGPVGGRLDAVA